MGVCNQQFPWCPGGGGGGGGTGTGSNIIPGRQELGLPRVLNIPPIGFAFPVGPPTLVQFRPQYQILYQARPVFQGFNVAFQPAPMVPATVPFSFNNPVYRSKIPFSKIYTLRLINLKS